MQSSLVPAGGFLSPGAWRSPGLHSSPASRPEWSMELLTSSYTEDQLLEQPFLTYSVGAETESYSHQPGQPQHFPDTEHHFHHQQHQETQQFWEGCTASLEEVQSAVFSSPVIEIQRLDGGGGEVGGSELILQEEQEVTSTESAGRRRREKKCKKKSSYKHVPHSEKPAHLVAKRNARERRRVEAVNAAFLKLRRAIPVDNKRGKRVSKVKILTRAIDYILNMKDAINQHDGLPQHVIYHDKDDDHLFAF